MTRHCCYTNAKYGSCDCPKHFCKPCYKRGNHTPADEIMHYPGWGKCYVCGNCRQERFEALARARKLFDKYLEELNK